MSDGLHFDAELDHTTPAEQVRALLLAKLGGIVDERVYVLGRASDADQPPAR